MRFSRINKRTMYGCIAHELDKIWVVLFFERDNQALHSLHVYFNSATWKFCCILFLLLACLHSLLLPHLICIRNVSPLLPTIIIPQDFQSKFWLIGQKIIFMLYVPKKSSFTPTTIESHHNLHTTLEDFE